jgi:Mn2+/Fe2+ NRAMP family transporter
MLVKFFKTVLGPAAIVAAGMIGAGAVSTRLLAGTWFRFELLWVALYVIPMVIFTVDSASRVGVLSGNRGIMEMIKTEIAPALAWFIFLPQVLLNIVINMAQMSVMTEAVYGVAGAAAPASITVSKVIIVLGITAVIVPAAVTGGVKRLQKVMTGLLMVILVCFIVVAVKGLLNWSTWAGLAAGLVPKVPADLPVRGSEAVRGGFTQLMAIAGQALPAAVFLSFGYFTGDEECTKEDLKKNLKKTAFNLGLVFGTFSVIVVVCGATALHSVYTGGNGGLHFSQISSVADAGKVMAPALPQVLGFLATPIFSIGLFVAAFTTMISVALIMAYFTVDIVGRNWKFRKGNRFFQWTFAFYIAVPALLSPFWKLDALIQAILGMAGNLVITPLVVLIIMYFINNRKYAGDHRAGPAHNLFLGITFLFSLVVVIRGVVNLVRAF